MVRELHVVSTRRRYGASAIPLIRRRYYAICKQLQECKWCLFMCNYKPAKLDRRAVAVYARISRNTLVNQWHRSVAEGASWLE